MAWATWGSPSSILVVPPVSPFWTKDPFAASELPSPGSPAPSGWLSRPADACSAGADVCWVASWPLGCLLAALLLAEVPFAAQLLAVPFGVDSAKGDEGAQQVHRPKDSSCCSAASTEHYKRGCCSPVTCRASRAENPVCGMLRTGPDS